MIRALRVLAGSVVVLAACSSSSGGGSGSKSDSGTGTKHDGGGATGDASGGMSVTTFCNALVTADATLFSKCIGGSATAWETQLNAASPCADIAAAVQSGRIVYDESKASACLTATAAISCGNQAAGAPEPADCIATIVGTVAASGTCFSSVDCAPDNFCSGLGGTTGSCTGTCAPLIAAGAACSAGDECVAGNTCSGSGSSQSCTAIAAAAGATLGGTCGYDSSSKTVTVCASGLACNAATLVCVTPVSQGAACTPGAGVCEYFTDCDPTTKTCKAYPGLGGGCGAAAGEDVVGCAGKTFCQTSSGSALVGTCAALGGGGAACTSGAQCASHACSTSDGGAGTCFPACTEE